MVSIILAKSIRSWQRSCLRNGLSPWAENFFFLLFLGSKNYDLRAFKGTKGCYNCRKIFATYSGRGKKWLSEQSVKRGGGEGGG